MSFTMMTTRRPSIGLCWILAAVCVALTLHAGGQLQADGEAMASPPSVDSASFVDHYLEVAEEIDPALAEQLRSMCQSDPVRFSKALRQLGPTLSELVHLRQSDPQLFWRKIRELHLEATIETLAANIRSARGRGETVNPATEVQLRGLVEAQLGARLKSRHQYLDKMRQELERAEAELSKESDNFSASVGERVRWLLTR
jgi:hypothetical protein